MTIWNEHNTECLKRWWKEGLSASKVALRIPGASRNAVIGKVFRLGLSGLRPFDCNHPRGDKHWNSRANRKYRPEPQKSARLPSRALTAAEPSLASLSRDAPPLPFNPHEARALQLLDCEPQEHERIPLLDAKRHQCRWPYDDGMVCGRKTVSVGGGSFCSHHARRAYFPKNGRHVA